MSALVLLDLLNKLGSRDKLRGLLSTVFYHFFCSKFNKFNNTVA